MFCAWCDGLVEIPNGQTLCLHHLCTWWSMKESGGIVGDGTIKNA
jgi:hypothetical protein